MDNLCDVPHIQVGHRTFKKEKTGCTVVLFDQPFVAGVDIRGSAPGTKEIEVLKFVRLVHAIHGVCFAGGSAFGLEAQSGVMQYLREKGIGFQTGYGVVPIVPAACIFDLGVGEPSFPDKSAGYQAAKSARCGDFDQGAVGAGCGATVGKLKGVAFASKGGLGSASAKVGRGRVGALVVVNSFGDVVKDGKVIAGARDENGNFISMSRYFLQGGKSPFPPFSSTVLVLLATNLKLDKEGCTKLAQAGQDALAEVIQPCHTLVDGDVAMAASSQEMEEDFFMLIEAAKDCVKRSVWKAVEAASSESSVS